MKEYNIDSSLYFSVDDILSYKRMINMIVGGTGTGKTYGTKKHCMQHFLDTDGEEQFMFWRRHNSDFADVMNFFEAYKGVADEDEVFKSDWVVDKKNRCFKYKGKVCGYYRSLDQMQRKGSEFPFVANIIFDEFIKHSGYERYLPDELNCFLGGIDAICRYKREVTVFCLANAVSMYNPYFLELGYIYDGNEFWAPKDKNNIGLANDTCVQFLKSAITKELQQTRFGRLISGTSYGAYSLNNISLGETKDFIKKKTKNCYIVLIFKIDNIDYGVWEDRATGEVFISRSVGNRNCIKFSCGGNERAEGYATIRALKGLPVWAFLTRQYDYGQIYYEDSQCKNAGIKFFKEGYTIY